MSFNSLLQEALDLTFEEEANALTESVFDDDEATLIEGLDEALFEHCGDGCEDFQANFDDNIDKYQFFNQSYTSLSQDELESMYNPDTTADLINSNYGDHHFEEDEDDDLEDHGLNEWADSLNEDDDFLDNPINYPIDFIGADEQLHEDDEDGFGLSEDFDFSLNEEEDDDMDSEFASEVESLEDDDDDDEDFFEEDSPNFY